MTTEGNVIESEGEIKNEILNLTILTIKKLLQDVGLLLRESEKVEPFKRLTVAFEQHSFVVILANNKIYVVKKRNSN